MICATSSIKITFDGEASSSSVLRRSKTNKLKQYRGNKTNNKKQKNEKQNKKQSKTKEKKQTNKNKTKQNR